MPAAPDAQMASVITAAEVVGSVESSAPSWTGADVAFFFRRSQRTTLSDEANNSLRLRRVRRPRFVL